MFHSWDENFESRRKDAENATKVAFSNLIATIQKSYASLLVVNEKVSVDSFTF